MSGNRMPTKTISPSRISRAAVATINSPKVYRSVEVWSFFGMSAAILLIFSKNCRAVLGRGGSETRPHIEHAQPSAHPVELQINRRFADLTDRRKRIAGSFFWRDPFLLVADDVQQQLLIFGCGHEILYVLFIAFVIDRLAGLRMEFLSRPASDVAIKFDIRRIELGLTGLQHAVKPLNQAGNFVAI